MNKNQQKNQQKPIGCQLFSLNEVKHYFRPGRDVFRTALETAMPHMLTGVIGERFGLPKEVLALGEVFRSWQHEELIENVVVLGKGGRPNDESTKRSRRSRRLSGAVKQNEKRPV